MSQRKRHIYIVGMHGLQNELLVLSLKERHGTLCNIEDSLHKVPHNDGNGPGKQRLILIDCIAKSREDIAAILESGARANLLSEYLVLFNLNYAIGIERYALDKGVRGFIYERDSVDNLLKMITAVFNGELWVSRKIMMECLLVENSGIPSVNKPAGLTSREVDILGFIAKGHSNKMISDKFCLSPHTVKTHVYRIFKKIKVSSRLQAAHWASRHL